MCVCVCECECVSQCVFVCAGVCFPVSVRLCVYVQECACHYHCIVLVWVRVQCGCENLNTMPQHMNVRMCKNHVCVCVHLWVYVLRVCVYVCNFRVIQQNDQSSGRVEIRFSDLQSTIMVIWYKFSSPVQYSTVRCSTVTIHPHAPHVCVISPHNIFYSDNILLPWFSCICWRTYLTYPIGSF